MTTPLPEMGPVRIAPTGATAARFTGPRVHHQVTDAGHNLPQEKPDAFAAAIDEVIGLGVDLPAALRRTDETT
jgi:hypothetical protein